VPEEFGAGDGGIVVVVFADFAVKEAPLVS